MLSSKKHLPEGDSEFLEIKHPVNQRQSNAMGTKVLCDVSPLAEADYNRRLVPKRMMEFN